MNKYCTSNYSKPFPGYCYNYFFIYGHRSSECRKPNQRWNMRMHERTNNATNRPLGMNNIITDGVMCYKHKNVGHIARYCRL